MKENELIERLKAQRILPIFRGSSDEIKSALSLMKPLNFKCIELTTTIPNWQGLLSELRNEYQVGVGTIKTNEDINVAISNGAEFLVSFGSFPELESASKKLPVIPGALTPSEFLSLQRSGIKLAKFYPASQFGPKYLKDLKILLPEMNFIVTGGIGVTENEIDEWISAGAIAMGMGSALGNPLTDEKTFSSKVSALSKILNAI